jgi:hypothetical protein
MLLRLRKYWTSLAIVTLIAASVVAEILVFQRVIRLAEHDKNTTPALAAALAMLAALVTAGPSRNRRFVNWRNRASAGWFLRRPHCA